MREIDHFYLKENESLKSTFLSLREIILGQDKDITESLKYGMPFFSYKGKMFCYFWFHKKLQQPYIGIVEGHRFDEVFLLQETRSRMKIMLIDQSLDLPKDQIEYIIHKTLDLYKSGVIKVRNN